MSDFRAGDIVLHGPTGEEWILAVDQFGASVMPCGWPETVAEARDCSLVNAATDEERVKQLEETGRSTGTRAGKAKCHILADALAAQIRQTKQLQKSTDEEINLSSLERNFFGF